MKCILSILSFGICLVIWTPHLSAQNSQSPSIPTSLPAVVNGSSGLQAYNVFRTFKGLGFVPGNTKWNKSLFENLTTTGLFGGSYNTATGTQALNSNTTGSYNTADGYQAVYSNTTGFSNTGLGYQALYSNTTGGYNTAGGMGALLKNNADDNTAFGYYALSNNSTGTFNTALGIFASNLNTTGSGLVAVGVNALADAQNEGYSVAVGYSALGTSMSSIGRNTAIGSNALANNSSGYNNTGTGADVLDSNSTGWDNTATGYSAMSSNSTGNYGVALGHFALDANTTGSSNTAVGNTTLTSVTTGSNNTALGAAANVASGAISNATALGFNAQASASNSVVVGSTSVTSIGGYAGWTNFSDGRYKQNIQQNIPGLAFINKLNPISYTLDINGIETKLHQNQKPITNKYEKTAYNYMDDPSVKQAMQEKSAVTYSGFVAQDVEKAADSVGYNFSGVDKPKDANQSFYGLRYGDFVVPLVKAVQELSASSNKKDSTINSLQEKVDSLQTQINEIRAMLLSKNQSVISAIPGASLDQNAPNPSSSSTTIAYGLPQGTISAQMQITDMSGKILQIIPLSGLGRNSVTIDTSSLSTGTYSYSLLINGQLAGTKKMVTAR